MKLTDLKTQYEGEIVLLTKEQCAQCDHMKRRLNRMGENYTEINLEKDPELLADVKAQGARTAPVMLTPLGRLLTTNVVEMENQLKEELKRPRYHHLYTPQETLDIERQNPELEVPKIAQNWTTIEGWGKHIGTVLTDKNIYVYSAEFTMWGAKVSTDIFDNPADLHKSTEYPHLVCEKRTVEDAVSSKITDILSKDIDDRWKQASIDYEIPTLETPREINISFTQWEPAEENTIVWMDNNNFEQASFYKWADFTTYLANTDIENAMETLQTVFPYLNETQLQSLKELNHPKAQTEIAAAAKGTEVIHAQHPTHATQTAPVTTNTQMPPQMPAPQPKHVL